MKLEDGMSSALCHPIAPPMIPSQNPSHFPLQILFPIISKISIPESSIFKGDEK